MSCADKRYQLFIRVKNDLVHNVEKVTKNNLTIISKPHAYLHTMKKTYAKFQNFPCFLHGMKDTYIQDTFWDTDLKVKRLSSGSHLYVLFYHVSLSNI